MRRTWLLLILVSLTLSLAVPMLFGGVDALRGLARASPALLALLLAMVMGAWVLRGERVRLLTRGLGTDISRRRAFVTVVASEFAAVATPANAGGPATYVFLLSRQGLAAGRGAAVVAVDQVMDWVFFATAVPLAILLFTSRGDVTHPLRIAGLMVGLLALGLVLLFLLVRHHHRITLAIGRLLARTRLRRLRYPLARGVIHFRRALGLLLTMGVGRLLLLYGFCFGHWMLRYGVLPVALWYLGESVPWGYLFAMQALLLFLGQATFLPGGGGGVELGFTALLAPFMDATAVATALLLWRFCTFYWYLLFGAPTFVLATGEMAGRLVSLRGS